MGVMWVLLGERLYRVVTVLGVVWLGRRRCGRTSVEREGGVGKTKGVVCGVVEWLCGSRRVFSELTVV